MATNPEFDPDRILRVLDRHGVEYVLVGGVAARVHGAQRATADIDCVPAITGENLERLAAALAELGARLRVGGLTDEEARQLPLQLDATTLAAFGTSTIPRMGDSGPDVCGGAAGDAHDLVERCGEDIVRMPSGRPHFI